MEYRDMEQYRTELDLKTMFVIESVNEMQEWLEPVSEKIRQQLSQGFSPEEIAREYSGLQGEILVPEDLVIDAIKRFR